MLQENYKCELDEVTLWEYRKALSGDLKHLRRDINVGTDEDDQKAFESVYDDYLKRFGLGDKYERFAEIQMELVEVYCEYIETDNEFLRNTINRLEVELERLMDNGKGGDLDDAIVIVSKWMGTMINERQIIAKDFFKALDTCIKEQEQLRAKYGKANKEE